METSTHLPCKIDFKDSSHFQIDKHTLFDVLLVAHSSSRWKNCPEKNSRFLVGSLGCIFFTYSLYFHWVHCTCAIIHTYFLYKENEAMKNVLECSCKAAMVLKKEKKTELLVEIFNRGCICTFKSDKRPLNLFYTITVQVIKRVKYLFFC